MTRNNLTSSHLDSLQILFAKNLTQRGFELSRNLGIGAGGISVVLLVAILQFDEFTITLKIAAIGLSISLPFWIIYFGSIEYFLYLGEKYYCHYLATKKHINHMAHIAGIGLAVSVGALLWHVTIWAGIIYIISVIVALIKIVLFTRSFAREVINDQNTDTA